MLTLHNLTFYQTLMASARSAIERGDFEVAAAAFRARYRDDLPDEPFARTVRRRGAFQVTLLHAVLAPEPERKDREGEDEKPGHDVAGVVWVECAHRRPHESASQPSTPWRGLKL